MEKRQLPVGVIQICWIQPPLFISANVKVVFDLITTLGLTFHFWPRSLDGPAPVPVVAMPPFPFSPLKFSGLMDLVLASDRRKILLRLLSIPLNLPGCWAVNCRYKTRQQKSIVLFMKQLF